MVSAPKPPDPAKTAAAQSGLNLDTAIQQQQMNMVDQYGPDGSLTYNQTGTNRYKNSSGKWVETPSYSATTRLSEAQQAIRNQTDKASLNLGTIANEQTGKVRDLLNIPFAYGNEDAEEWASDLGAKRLDPRFQQEQNALRTQLIASGLRPGSAAFDQQMSQLGQTKNDAYNQLALNGRQQAFTEALTERNQPLNEISALMSGSQVSMPQFQQTPQTSVAGVDYAGMVNSDYQAQSQAAAGKMGGLFGLAAAPFSMFNLPTLSDRRAKKDIRVIGKLANGLPWYEFRYLTDESKAPIRQGVMADDVRKVMPAAVVFDEASGFDRVHYDLVLEVA
jgi:hypothetical protein